MTLQYRLIAEAVALLVAFMAGWSVNGWRKDGEIQELKLSYAEVSRQAEQAARAKEQDFSRQLKKAQDDFLSRQNRLLADARSARAESSRLHDSLADFRRQLPDLAREAINRYADAASVVFDECQREYSALAEQADRIDNDKQALENAWPN